MAFTAVAGLKLITFDRALKSRDKDELVLEIPPVQNVRLQAGTLSQAVPYTPLEKYFPFDPMALIVPGLRKGRRYGETITATSATPSWNMAGRY